MNLDIREVALVFFRERIVENEMKCRRQGWIQTSTLNLSALLDTIWCHGSGSELVQVMVISITTPSHHLKQFWLIVGSGVVWYSHETIFTCNTHDIILLNHTNSAKSVCWIKWSRTPCTDAATWHDLTQPKKNYLNACVVLCVIIHM